MYFTKITVSIYFFFQHTSSPTPKKKRNKLRLITLGNVKKLQVCEVGNPTLRYERFIGVIELNFVCALLIPNQFLN